MKVEDALHLLESIQQTFPDDGSIYNRFLDFMVEHRKGMLGVEGLKQEITFLFWGCGALLEEFNKFIPDGYDKIPTDIHR